ncbi:MAG TPA: heme-binding protein [Steroidobacteraceae bacterium]|jgi:glc operon protein GlcG
MKMIKAVLLVVGALVVASSTAVSQQAPATDHVEAGVTTRGLPLGQIRPMTVAIAKQLVEAARKASCTAPGTCSGAFCVADDAGVIVYLETIDGVLAGGPELCMEKAITPALWRRPTRTFQEAVVKQTNTSYADGTFPHMTTSPGGVPLFKNGRIVGGFGIAAVGPASEQIDKAVIAEATKIFGKQD